MDWRRLLSVAGIAAAVLLGVALRLTTRPRLRSDGRVRALTSDDYYHLRRARFAVSHFPRTIVFDPLMNFPDGGVPIWPPLFDVVLATPSRALHGSGASPDAIEREAAWVPLVLAAGAIALSGALGARIAGPIGAVALAAFVAVAPGHIRWTQYGHSDQHVLESFAGLLVFVLFLRSRERPGIAAEVATAVALAIAVLSWQGAIYWGALIALALFLEALRTRRSILRATLAILGLASGVVFAGTAAWLGPHRSPLTYVSFGFFQPLFLVSLCGGTVLLETIVRVARGQLSRRELAGRAVAVAIAAIVVLPFSDDLLFGFLRGTGYVLGRTNEVAGRGGYVHYPRHWLHGIFEARPILADGPGFALGQLSAAFFLAPAAVVLWAARALRGERPALSIALAVWGAVTLLLVFSQRLNSYYAAPLVGATLIELARLLYRRIPAAGVARAAVVTLVIAALLWTMATGLRTEIAAIEPPGSDLFATLDWMRAHLPRTADPYDSALLGLPPWPAGVARASSVLAPWSLGHLILYEAEQPVVANNFGYGFLDSIRFFLAESEDEALRVARTRRSRWVLATDLAPRINDYATYIDRPPYLAAGPDGRLRPGPRYFGTIQSRLYDFDGAGARVGDLVIAPLAHFRLRYHSQSAIRRGDRWLARWKVFEILE